VCLFADLHIIMGQAQGGLPGAPNQGGKKDDKKDKDKQEEKKKYERPLPTRVGRRKKRKGPDPSTKTPAGSQASLPERIVLTNL